VLFAVPNKGSTGHVSNMLLFLLFCVSLSAFHHDRLLAPAALAGCILLCGTCAWCMDYGLHDSALHATS
jgi:hypothetical protein